MVVRSRRRSPRDSSYNPCRKGNIDGRLAYDIADAAYVIRTVNRLDKELQAEVRQKAKIAAITLHRAPWE